MSTNTKPLAEWTLGEVKALCEGRVNCYLCPLRGILCREEGEDSQSMAQHPICWDLTEKPRFTEDEVATMRVLYAAGVRYIARDKNGSAYWFECKPEKDKLGTYGCPLGGLDALQESMFSSILPGQSVNIAGIIGKGDGAACAPW